MTDVRDEHQDEQAQVQAAQEIQQAANMVEDVVERMAYALIAFFVTLMVTKYFLHIDPHKGGYELGVLNGGLAYYSHAASGRVIRALYTLARAQQKVRRSRKEEAVGEQAQPE